MRGVVHAGQGIEHVQPELALRQTDGLLLSIPPDVDDRLPALVEFRRLEDRAPGVLAKDALHRLDEDRHVARAHAGVPGRARQGVTDVDVDALDVLRRDPLGNGAATPAGRDRQVIEGLEHLISGDDRRQFHGPLHHGLDRVDDLSVRTAEPPSPTRELLAPRHRPAAGASRVVRHVPHQGHIVGMVPKARLVGFLRDEARLKLLAPRVLVPLVDHPRRFIPMRVLGIQVVDDLAVVVAGILVGRPIQRAGIEAVVFVDHPAGDEIGVEGLVEVFVPFPHGRPQRLLQRAIEGRAFGVQLAVGHDAVDQVHHARPVGVTRQSGQGVGIVGGLQVETPPRVLLVDPLEFPGRPADRVEVVDGRGVGAVSQTDKRAVSGGDQVRDSVLAVPAHAGELMRERLRGAHALRPDEVALHPSRCLRHEIRHGGVQGRGVQVVLIGLLDFPEIRRHPGLVLGKGRLEVPVEGRRDLLGVGGVGHIPAEPLGEAILTEVRRWRAGVGQRRKSRDMLADRRVDTRVVLILQRVAALVGQHVHFLPGTSADHPGAGVILADRRALQRHPALTCGQAHILPQALGEGPDPLNIQVGRLGNRSGRNRRWPRRLPQSVPSDCGLMLIFRQVPGRGFRCSERRSGGGLVVDKPHDLIATALSAFVKSGGQHRPIRGDHFSAARFHNSREDGGSGFERVSRRLSSHPEQVALTRHRLV